MKLHEYSPGDGRTYQYYWCLHKNADPPKDLFDAPRGPWIFIGFLNLGIGSGVLNENSSMTDISETFGCTGEQVQIIRHIYKECCNALVQDLNRQRRTVSES